MVGDSSKSLWHSHTVGNSKTASRFNAGGGESGFPLSPLPSPPAHAGRCLPFIICELVSVVIGRNDVHEENVFRFGIKAGHLHFVTGKHPPGREGEEGRKPEKGRGRGERKTQRENLNANTVKSRSTHLNGRSNSSWRSTQEKSSPHSALGKIHSRFPLKFWGGDRPRGEREAGGYL